MKPKTARRWLTRNRWHMIQAEAEWGVGKPMGLWAQYWLCLSLTNLLFRRF